MTFSVIICAVLQASHRKVRRNVLDMIPHRLACVVGQFWRVGSEGLKLSRIRANQHHNRHIQPLLKKLGQNSSRKD